ncbi:TetR/AcrR family transcriptional regulator [Pseudonocardia eucalypti]|uniref:TetR/AcrR family transcriptional regulator n=1 Tax=Pseudonocardia eucalypti TaxID=648755 RepID=A0ABP9PVI0_9PSEU|nr:AcrR family transcriptional regulator [Pseudonocardia eucalypti]
MGRNERAARILDATAELVLRWGSKRVTIEEVAKRAGIGKGTVYLHFESRAWLFMCVLMRESLELMDQLAGEIERNPAALLPDEQARLTFLEVQRRPLLLAMFSRDGELLGEMAQDPAVGPLRGIKGELADDMFGVLREHGLLRTDLDVETIRYLVGAIQTGFYLYPPVPGSIGDDPERAASALAHAIRSAVQPPGEPEPAALAAALPGVLAGYQRMRAALARAVAGRPPGEAGAGRAPGLVSAGVTVDTTTRGAS